MKIFKKFNPNEDYLLRIQISMAIVLVAINFAFTRTVVKKVDMMEVLLALPIVDQGTIHMIPPPTFKKKTSTSTKGSKVVVEEIVTSLNPEVSIPEKEFDFDPNKARNFTGKTKEEGKEEKIKFHIPDAPFAVFPGGNERIPEYLQPRIEYPEEALSIGAACSMEVELIIDENGWVKEVNIISEKEDAFYFRESIREVLLAMPKFVPAVSNNRYIESRITIPIEFILN